MKYLGESSTVVAFVGKIDKEAFDWIYSYDKSIRKKKERDERD